jgi:hypothetical protein
MRPIICGYIVFEFQQFPRAYREEPAIPSNDHFLRKAEASGYEPEGSVISRFVSDVLPGKKILEYLLYSTARSAILLIIRSGSIPGNPLRQIALETIYAIGIAIMYRDQAACHKYLTKLAR